VPLLPGDAGRATQSRAIGVRIGRGADHAGEISEPRRKAPQDPVTDPPAPDGRTQNRSTSLLHGRGDGSLEKVRRYDAEVQRRGSAPMMRLRISVPPPATVREARSAAAWRGPCSSPAGPNLLPTKGAVQCRAQSVLRRIDECAQLVIVDWRGSR